jgi:hypothetical protein
MNSSHEAKVQRCGVVEDPAADCHSLSGSHTNKGGRNTSFAENPQAFVPAPDGDIQDALSPQCGVGIGKFYDLIIAYDSQQFDENRGVATGPKPYHLSDGRGHAVTSQDRRSA